MASITIRKLDDATKQRLRLRAAQHRRSMEDEVRHILRATLANESAAPANLPEAIHRRFAPLGGIDLPLPPRDPMREPPKPVK
ncbi:MAG TPA: plasmid stabilization protein [Casimicrobiaceae bacterium]|jgi:plasmid stability protein